MFTPIDRELLPQHVGFLEGVHKDGSTFHAPYFSLIGMQIDQFLCILPINVKIGSTLQFNTDITCTNIAPVGPAIGEFQPHALILENEELKQVHVIDHDNLQRKDHTFLSAYIDSERKLDIATIAFKYVGDHKGKEGFEILNSQNNAPVFVAHDTIIGVTVLHNAQSGGLIKIPSALSKQPQHLH